MLLKTLLLSLQAAQTASTHPNPPRVLAINVPAVSYGKTLSNSSISTRKSMRRIEALLPV